MVSQVCFLSSLRVDCRSVKAAGRMRVVIEGRLIAGNRFNVILRAFHKIPIAGKLSELV